MKVEMKSDPLNRTKSNGLNCETKESKLSSICQMSYTAVKLLQEGAYAKVYLVKDAEGRQFAAKLINSTATDIDKGLRLIELDVMARLRSPFILSMHSLAKFGDRIAIIMPLYESDLFEWRVKHEVTNKEEAHKMAAMMARGLLDLHRSGIHHMDIRPENFLIKDGHIVLSDFGHARYFHGETLKNTYVEDYRDLDVIPENDSIIRMSERHEVYSLMRTFQFMFEGIIDDDLLDRMEYGAITLEEVVDRLDGSLPAMLPSRLTECEVPDNFEEARSLAVEMFKGERLETVVLTLSLLCRMDLGNDLSKALPYLFNFASAILKDAPLLPEHIALAETLKYCLYVPNFYTASKNEDEVRELLLSTRDMCKRWDVINDASKDARL